VRVFLLSLKAGAAGLTLTAACRVVLLEPALDPAVEQQAVARVHRIGQVRLTTPAACCSRLSAGGAGECVCMSDAPFCRRVGATLTPLGGRPVIRPYNRSIPQRVPFW
jgi:hypothetical protein